MIHYADSQEKDGSDVSHFLIYADPMDPLIDDGWRIVPVEEKQTPGEGKMRAQEREKRGQGRRGLKSSPVSKTRRRRNRGLRRWPDEKDQGTLVG